MSTTPRSFPVPLAYDTIYYVESPDNEPLNQAMRRIAASGQPLFANSEMQPFPFKLLCLTQEELANDRLGAELAGKYDPDLVADTIADLRECLHVDTGGTLTARCLPKFKGHVRVDDYAVCSFEGFGSTSPEKALEDVRKFARTVAEENFQRLSDETFYTYQRAKEEYGRPQRYSGGGMGFIIVPPDPKEIIRKMQKRLGEINDTIDAQTNYDDVIEMLKADLKKLEDRGKMDTFCKLLVDDDKLYLKISDTEMKEVEFIRCDKAKTLYVFYLQQIQRAKKNPGVSQYLSREELEEYKDELFEIYQYFSGRINCRMEDLRDLWDVSRGRSFLDATSSIRRYFEREFDVDTIQKKYNKSYFCTRKDDKAKDGGRRYGVDLDVDDFDLDQFNYKKIKPIHL